jgi:hypothetical protein
MSTPRYLSLLSDADKQAYEHLRLSLSSPTCKNRRNRSIETFRSVVDCIRSFVIGRDDDHAKRALVCGICWFDDAIAINTHQFRILTNKSKSSINGLFQSLGYGTVPSGSEAAAPLIRYFPFMRGNFTELRQWTVRQKSAAGAPSFVTPPPGAPPAEGDGCALRVGKPLEEARPEALGEDRALYGGAFEDPFAFSYWGEPFDG